MKLWDRKNSEVTENRKLIDGALVLNRMATLLLEGRAWHVSYRIQEVKSTELDSTITFVMVVPNGALD